MRQVIIFFNLVFLATSFVSSASAASISKAEMLPIIELLDANKCDSARTCIEALEAKHHDDPEIFVLWVNYYYAQSYQSVVVINQTDSSGHFMSILDSTHQPIAYVSDSVVFYEDSLKMAVSILHDAIGKYPYRMDFHVSLMQITQETGYYSEMTAAILHVIELTKTQSNWQSSFAEPLNEDAAQCLLESIQHSASLLFNDASTTNDSLFLLVSQVIVERYPRSVYGYTNLGLMELANERYDEAIPHLMKAYAIDSTDTVILFDLALAFERKGDKMKAREWYERVLAVGSDEDRAYAQGKIDSLAN